jgi:hypothetical protein
MKRIMTALLFEFVESKWPRIPSNTKATVTSLSSSQLAEDQFLFDKTPQLHITAMVLCYEARTLWWILSSLILSTKTNPRCCYQQITGEKQGTDTMIILLGYHVQTAIP